MQLVSSLAGEIRIIGSRETADAAKKVLEEFGGFVKSEVVLPMCEEHRESLGGDCEQGMASLPSGSRKELSDATDAFAEQARVDLEAD
jgi:hypothetical protein